MHSDTVKRTTSAQRLLLNTPHYGAAHWLFETRVSDEQTTLLQQAVIEKASIDEFYIDATALVDALCNEADHACDDPDTVVVEPPLQIANEFERRLGIGAGIAARIRRAVFDSLGAWLRAHDLSHSTSIVVQGLRAQLGSQPPSSSPKLAALKTNPTARQSFPHGAHTCTPLCTPHVFCTHNYRPIIRARESSIPLNPSEFSIRSSQVGCGAPA